MGERRSFAAGETLVHQGQRDAPWLVLERGRVRVLDRKPGKDVWIAEADAGTFLGDIAIFTGEPTISASAVVISAISSCRSCGACRGSSVEPSEGWISVRS